MAADVEQVDGLKLRIDSVPSSGNRLLTVRLTGTEFLSEVVIGNEALDGQGYLTDFFIGASRQPDFSGTWRSLCQDVSFTISTEPGYEELFLRVYLGSNSNDNCDWQVNATLLLEHDQLQAFGRDIPLPQSEP